MLFDASDHSPGRPLIVFTTPACEPDQAVVRLWGEVDLTTAEQLTVAMQELRRSGCRVVHVDLSRTTFLDCAGLRVLVCAHNEFLRADGAVVLIGVGRRIARLLRITHLDEALFTDGGEGLPDRRHLAVVDGGDR